jgi:hypothetical protein
MTVAAPGFVRRDARPPITTEVAPVPGAASVPRPTAVPRPWIEPLLGIDAGDGHDPADPAVRRYWTAIIGPGAVADLLRLIAAARLGKLIRQPTRLGALAAEGLIERRAATVIAPPRVPYLSEGQQRRLTPRLRAEYRQLVGD